MSERIVHFEKVIPCDCPPEACVEGYVVVEIDCECGDGGVNVAPACIPRLACGGCGKMHTIEKVRA